jgi:enamine deaminase RidA (YjgF/YER057c/UK114 family)
MSPSLLSHIDTLTETIGEKFEKSMDHILNSNIWIEKIDTTKDNLRISFIDAMSDLI